MNNDIVRDVEGAGTSYNQTATSFLRSKLGALQVNQKTHYATCEKLQRVHTRIGILIVVLTTIMLGFAFGTIDVIRNYGSYVVGGLSLVAAILAGIQTFSDFAGRASEHQGAAVAYGALLREFELRTSGAFSETDNAEELLDLMGRWTEISKTAPLTKIHLRAKHGDSSATGES